MTFQSGGVRITRFSTWLLWSPYWTSDWHHFHLRPTGHHKKYLMKTHVNVTFSSSRLMITRFLRLLPWWPYWMSDRHHFYLGPARLCKKSFNKNPMLIWPSIQMAILYVRLTSYHLGPTRHHKKSFSENPMTIHSGGVAMTRFSSWMLW